MAREKNINLSFFTCLLAWFAIAASAPAPIRIYLDAGMTGAKSSGIAIERGIRIALAEVGNRLAGRPVEIKILNRRGHSARSGSPGGWK